MRWIKCEGGNMPPWDTKVLTYWPGDEKSNPVFLINERPGVHRSGHGNWWTSRPDQVPTHWASLTGPEAKGDLSDGYHGKIEHVD